jgi:hypothetical protein
MEEEQSDVVDPKYRESFRGIIETEIEMVKNNKWLSDEDKRSKVIELTKMISR